MPGLLPDVDAETLEGPPSIKPSGVEQASAPKPPAGRTIAAWLPDGIDGHFGPDAYA